MVPITSVSQACRIARGTAPGRPRRSIPTGTPPANGRSVRPDPVTVKFGDQAVAVFWGHHRLHRGRGLPQDLHFFLKVADPLPCSGQLGAFFAVVPGFRPRSTRSWCRHRYKHDSAIPSDAATSRMLRPDSIRSRARRRNSADTA